MHEAVFEAGWKYYAPFCLSCVAHSALQQASCSGGKSEQFNLASENEPTIGEGASLVGEPSVWRRISSRACVARQRLYSLTREALDNLLELSQSLLLEGKSTEQVLEVMMPS